MNNKSKREPDYVPIFVYGATFVGLAIASAAPGGTFLVEPTALSGSEFIAGFNPGDCWEQPLISDETNALRDAI